MHRILNISASMTLLAGIASCASAVDTKTPGIQWTEEQAQAWGAKQPWLVGANFNPSNTSNQLDMWQADTFIS